MFKNLRELVANMSDDATCRKYLIEQRWNGNVVCPYCECSKCYIVEKGKRFKCSNKECGLKFSATVGTIFENSKIPLNKWFYAVYVATGHKKGISSYQLARDLGVSQKSTWFMLHRIREVFKNVAPEMLDTVVEVDSTFTGGRMRNKHVDVRAKAHLTNVSHVDNKTEILGYLQRQGNLKLQLVDRTKTFKENVIDNVKPEAVVITDNFPGFVGLNKSFEGHVSVDHKKDEYVRGYVHTNSIEGAFSHFKRMVFGTYHQLSPKHLSAYCNEFCFRFNNRKINDASRFILTLGMVEKRLTYNTLVHGKSSIKKTKTKEAK